jgi:hypothetical protein
LQLRFRVAASSWPSMWMNYRQKAGQPGGERSHYFPTSQPGRAHR